MTDSGSSTRQLRNLHGLGPRVWHLFEFIAVSAVPYVRIVRPRVLALRSTRPKFVFDVYSRNLVPSQCH